MEMLLEKLTETVVVEKVKEYLLNKEKGNWHEETIIQSNLHEKGVDLKLRGGKRNSEYFFIECKCKSYSPSAKSINAEGWLNALGQLVTRMKTPRIIKTGKNKGNVNRAYKYGLGLCKESATVALRRIPREIAKVLNLYIFSVDDEGNVEMFTPSKFKK